MRETRFRTGAGRLCLDLVRTLRYRGQPDAVEELPDAEAVLAWVQQVAPPIDGPTVEHGELAERTRTLRDAIYQLIATAKTAKPTPNDIRATVNDAARGPAPVPELRPNNSLVWTAADTVEAALTLVARDALDLVTSAALPRVRCCADPSCGALFLDSSRSASRRWCSMDVCGNRAKKTAIRRRG